MPDADGRGNNLLLVESDTNVDEMLIRHFSPSFLPFFPPSFPRTHNILMKYYIVVIISPSSSSLWSLFLFLSIFCYPFLSVSLTVPYLFLSLPLFLSLFHSPSYSLFFISIFTWWLTTEELLKMCWENCESPFVSDSRDSAKIHIVTMSLIGIDWESRYTMQSIFSLRCLSGEALCMVNI